jgi:hypothetical protein
MPMPMRSVRRISLALRSTDRELGEQGLVLNAQPADGGDCLEVTGMRISAVNRQGCVFGMGLGDKMQVHNREIPMARGVESQERV